MIFRAAFLLVATATFTLACEPGAESFGARCNSDRDCSEMSYCMSGCGGNEARCIPYGNDTDFMRYRPVECCAGKDLYYTGMVSEKFKERVHDAMNKAGAGDVADATQSFPPTLVQAALNDQAQQCMMCNGPPHAAPMAERCSDKPTTTPPPPPPPTTTTPPPTTTGPADAGPAPAATTPPATTPPELAPDAGPAPAAAAPK